jgi:hypothetical protein
MARFVESAPDAVLAVAQEMLHRGLLDGTDADISARRQAVAEFMRTGCGGATH